VGTCSYEYCLRVRALKSEKSLEAQEENGKNYRRIKIKPKYMHFPQMTLIHGLAESFAFFEILIGT
jgi:hypothetical protein